MLLTTVFTLFTLTSLASARLSFNTASQNLTVVETNKTANASAAERSLGAFGPTIGLVPPPGFDPHFAQSNVARGHFDNHPLPPPGLMHNSFQFQQKFQKVGPFHSFNEKSVKSGVIGGFPGPLGFQHQQQSLNSFSRPANPNSLNNFGAQLHRETHSLPPSGINSVIQPPHRRTLPIGCECRNIADCRDVSKLARSDFGDLHDGLCKPGDVVCCNQNKVDQILGGSGVKKPGLASNPFASNQCICQRSTNCSPPLRLIPITQTAQPRCLPGMSLCCTFGVEQPVPVEPVVELPPPPPYTVLSDTCGIPGRNPLARDLDAGIPKEYEADFGRYPWMVAMLDPLGDFVCGGTLIDDRVVLTAAHCVRKLKDADITVRVGFIDFDTRDQLPPQEILVNDVIIHSDYHSGTLANDIAVMLLKTPVKRNQYVRPVCLPPYHDYSTYKCTVTGWGKNSRQSVPSQRLKAVDLPFVSRDICEKEYRDSELGPNYHLDKSFLCAGAPNKDACFGDGGGPLVCEHEGRYRLVGIVSWGIGCGSYPGVFTDVSKFVPWIYDVLETYGGEYQVLPPPPPAAVAKELDPIDKDFIPPNTGVQIITGPLQSAPNNGFLPPNCDCRFFHECPSISPQAGVLSQAGFQCAHGYILCCTPTPIGPVPSVEIQPPVGPPPPPPPPYVVDSEKCGQKGTSPLARVIDGDDSPISRLSDANFGEYAWQAAILTVDLDFVCGATLIKPNVVVTAAHCVRKVKDADILVRLGEYDAVNTNELPYQDVPVKKVVIHSEYHSGTLANDIAVIILAHPAELNSYIRPACLPPFHDYVSKKCYVSGWGKGNPDGQFSQILKAVEVPIVSPEVCQKEYRLSPVLGAAFNLDPSFLCAGAPGKDACFGDGGGPLVCEYEGRWRLVGIVSWGLGCGEYPGVYTDVTQFVPWIYDVLETYEA